ncbi:MAG: F0F1 ATP synthase subunit delta [Anaerolineae bacterium]|nr:F0F1 ATP synthase subunit delta [Anaerolineae bacterium]
MSGETWQSEISNLAGGLGREGAISPEQAEMLQRLAEEIGGLTRSRTSRDEAIVRTAVPLTPEERAELERLVAARFGRGRRVVFQVDPELLGGVWLRVGGRIVDGSLRGRLEALRRQMGAT